MTSPQLILGHHSLKPIVTLKHEGELGEGEIYGQVTAPNGIRIKGWMKISSVRLMFPSCRLKIV